MEMVSNRQKELAAQFLQFHHDEDILILLNAWDPGSSKLVEASGFKAVATTSMGIAASLGHPDCEIITLTQVLQVVTGIVQAVQIPVTVDFEAGYGRTTREVVASVTRLVETGAVGLNIEDSVGMSPVLMDVDAFCERISAIRSLSDSLGIHLVINARTDAFYTTQLSPTEKLAESIRRGNAYRQAGADCIFVQPVWDRDTIRTLVNEIHAPVNILANPSIGDDLPPSVRELQDLGVARLSLGSSLMKATLALMKKVADELLISGTYTTLSDSMMPRADATLAYRMATGTR